MAQDLCGKVIRYHGDAIRELLAARYEAISLVMHTGDFSFRVLRENGPPITLYTSPTDESGKFIRIDGIHDPGTDSQNTVQKGLNSS